MQNYYDENLINRTSAIMEILKINSPEKCKSLTESLGYAGPELYALKLTEWVNKNVQINPESAESLAIYSLLTARPIEDIKKQMQSNQQENIGVKTK